MSRPPEKSGFPPADSGSKGTGVTAPLLSGGPSSSATAPAVPVGPPTNLIATAAGKTHAAAAMDSKTNIIMDLTIWEKLLEALALFLVVMAFPFSLFFCLIVVAQYEQAVVFRLGKLMGVNPKGPGLVFILPCLDAVRRVDLRTFTFNVPTQEVLTKDCVTVAVDAVVYYRIYGSVMSVVNVENANHSTRLLAQTTLRNFLGMVDLYQLLTAREHIAHLMQDSLMQITEMWGVKVERVEIKDVRLPTQLQRAMAAEAEATREARAKVIAAEGEERASTALTIAATRLSECPVALQLRYLQTLNSISAEKNSTIIFPLPIDIVSSFRDQHAAQQKSQSQPSQQQQQSSSPSSTAPPMMEQ